MRLWSLQQAFVVIYRQHVYRLFYYQWILADGTSLQQCRCYRRVERILLHNNVHVASCVPFVYSNSGMLFPFTWKIATPNRENSNIVILQGTFNICVCTANDPMRGRSINTCTNYNAENRGVYNIHIVGTMYAAERFSACPNTFYDNDSRLEYTDCTKTRGVS